MGHKLILLLLALGSIACETLDFKGMVLTYTSVDDRYDYNIKRHEALGKSRITLPQDSYTFYLHSDSHVGDTSNLHWLHQAARNNQVNAIFMLGDLTTGHKEDYETLHAFLENNPHPKSYITPGNHDLYFKGWEHYERYFDASFYTLELILPQDSDLFIFLDSGGSTLGAKQMQWFKDVLRKERPLYRNCIVLTHNNILLSRHTISTYPQIEEVEELLTLFLEHKVNYCFSGHDHQYDHINFGLTDYYVTDAIADYNAKASFLILGNEKGKISVSKKMLP